MTPNWLLVEKAVSKSQQRFMGMVHKYQKEGGKASPKVKKAAGSMSDQDAEDFASTKHKGLPEKVEEEDNTLSAKERRAVPKKKFAYTSKAPKGQSKKSAKGKYPMPDAQHAAAAKGFAAMHHGKGSAEYKRVASKASELGYGNKSESFEQQLNKALFG